jgi:hypothetical protein
MQTRFHAPVIAQWVPLRSNYTRPLNDITEIYNVRITQHCGAFAQCLYLLGYTNNADKRSLEDSAFMATECRQQQ